MTYNSLTYLCERLAFYNAFFLLVWKSGIQFYVLNVWKGDITQLSVLNVWKGDNIYHNDVSYLCGRVAVIQKQKFLWKDDIFVIPVWKSVIDAESNNLRIKSLLYLCRRMTLYNLNLCGSVTITQRAAVCIYNSLLYKYLSARVVSIIKVVFSNPLKTIIFS